MSADYLWDRSGIPDPDLRSIEVLLAQLAHDEPLDELRLAKGQRGEPARATAQEPATAPPSSGRVKGNMHVFDKRIIGVATLTGAALSLLGVAAYKSIGGTPPGAPRYVELHGNPKTAVLTHSLAWTPPAAPVAPTTGADLAITAGENARIHVPFGAVDVEIQSACRADVEMTISTAGGLQHVHPEDPDSPLHFVPLPPAESHALGGEMVVPGIQSADGRVTTYHLAPDTASLGIVQYASRCGDRPPTRGVIEIDRDDGGGPIAPITNARLYNDGPVPRGALAHGLHVFGTVLPGASVSLGATSVALLPVDPSAGDLPVGSAFSINVPLTLQRLVVAVRVDDAMGTHFYVIHPTVVIDSCVDTTDAPRKAAAALDAQGDHAGALNTLEAAIAACTPDRNIVALVFTYACRAGDARAATTYWRKLPHELKTTLEVECQRSGILRDTLDAPE